MSTRTVLVAAAITAIVLGIVGTRANASTDPRRSGSIAEAGR
ncbi:hypothetical protein ABT009_33360 [Streptomyces sp. NPDC002896]|uniref:Uncharacterized protein n=1 Tax=Streptomyces jeddahensis TaxID=1716141 RepID=A0A177HJM6_9ACTN|nr:hypothetical protein [Streptomyces jeddahensis]OAH10434.1 hypothetical protein STSP_61720 [Streptomyces jeddahensis]